MIKLSNPPVPEWDGIMAFMPVVGTYEFALSNDDMLIYYWQLFENRTNNDEPYIEKYSSLKELEKMCTVYVVDRLKVRLQLRTLKIYMIA